MSFQIRANVLDQIGAAALPMLEYIFRTEMEQHASIREMLSPVVRATSSIWQSTEMHDLPLHTQVDELSDYSYERQPEGADRTYNIIKYGLGMAFSEEVIEDGKFDFIASAIRAAARSAVETKEISYFNLFNNGFTSEVTADGLPVFDLAHTLPSGLTFRNELVTPADLSPAALNTALVDFKTQFVGDSGIKYKQRPKWLLVHPEEEQNALELLGSTLKPNVETNDINTFKRENIEVISTPHLTDTDAWFLIADKSLDLNGSRIMMRKDVETKAAGPDAGFDDDSLKYKSRYREAVGIPNARGLYGTPGAA